MACKSRPSKSYPSKMGRKWTQDDVLAYNIKVVYQDLMTFFGVTDLPPPNVENDALTAQQPTSSNQSISLMVHYMTSLANPIPNFDNIQTLTIDFVRVLFNLLRYDDATRRFQVMFMPTLSHITSQGRPPQLDI